MAPWVLALMFAASDASLDLRVSSGAEWDTNATRTATHGTSDGLARLLVDTSVSLRLGELHTIAAEHVFGAKRFVKSSDEDLFLHDLGVRSSHTLASWLIGRLNANVRSSRIRGGGRDYSTALAGGSLAVMPFRTLALAALGDLSRFDFDIDEHFSYDAFRLGVEATWQPFASVIAVARAGRAWRDYRGHALVLATQTYVDEDGSTVTRQFRSFCDETPQEQFLLGIACTPTARDDVEDELRLLFNYRGSFLASGEYLVRVQRSSSVFENIDRHRLSAWASIHLPLELTLHLMGAMQWNRGVSATDGLLYAEDDENQNSITAQVSWKLSDAVGLDLRYALYAYTFTDTAQQFLRQTAYFGVAFRTDADGSSGPDVAATSDHR